MVSDHRNANRGGPAQPSKRNDDYLFVVGRSGEYKPPCGHDGGQYGCAQFCGAIGARDIGDCV
jgi:hypothetical protein